MVGPFWRLAVAISAVILASPAPASAEPITPGWQQLNPPSRLTDVAGDPGVFITSVSIPGDDPAELGVRCHNGSTDTYVKFSNHDFGDGDDIDYVVQYRVDKKAAEQFIGRGNAGEAIAQFGNKEFALELSDAAKLYVEATDAEGRPVRAEFHFADTQTAFGPIRAACAW